MNVLVVKANNRPATEGISSKMHEVFMNEIDKGLNIQTFDVFEEDMPYFGQDFFNAMQKSAQAEAMTETEQRILTASAKAMDAFMEADVVVFAFPLWNMTIPAALQTFIDYIYRAGMTFKYTENGPVGLVPEKKVIILNARGGVYSTPEAAPAEMSVTYIRNIMNFFGIQDINEVIIEGHAADPEAAPAIIEEGMERVKQAARSLQGVRA
ncbi:FMN-dependent NADH-azoreductase [Planococcus glaciei]|uniref:FMN dependent NADH:quinone oxidoreductase n=1 Tax=Planococcus glaciei TaxID=459472 RepID=A0A1G7Z5P2_9BACL|nr:FMN-dependent NADH-azoreductase [Planococcus glaciei]KOF10823.1 FMN-dependent NADH-azoreductase [Planococcus glaciei]MBX0316519.1 FMN-dependent NADH-azoreductase [Planococcus glaciei]QDY45633.1 FMN-dependent NADH-azoreductase [Planococcus glaciei]QKX50811.1 FMN-dependent NADH-azoreductase [Planococcus glaciei]SDH04053.1 FMN-dependent NADH-azoreductase [Planococcus glaciei]